MYKGKAQNKSLRREFLVISLRFIAIGALAVLMGYACTGAIS